MNLVKIYNDKIKFPKKKYNPNAKPSFPPSSLGHPCIRACYYKYSKAPEELPFPIKVQRILRLGTQIGDDLAAVYRDAGILVDYRNPDGKFPIVFGKECREFPVTAEALEINWGYIDAVFVSDGKLTLGEFKSINTDKYSGLQGPLDDHLIQGVTYLHLFNAKLKRGDYAHIPELKGFTKAEGISFLYYNKNSSYLKDFYVTDTKPTFKRILDRIFYIQSIAKTKVLPEKTEYFCSSCTYKKRCDAGLLAPRDVVVPF